MKKLTLIICCLMLCSCRATKTAQTEIHQSDSHTTTEVVNISHKDTLRSDLYQSETHQSETETLVVFADSSISGDNLAQLIASLGNSMPGSNTPLSNNNSLRPVLFVSHSVSNDNTASEQSQTSVEIIAADSLKTSQDSSFVSEDFVKVKSQPSCRFGHMVFVIVLLLLLIVILVKVKR